MFNYAGELLWWLVAPSLCGSVWGLTGDTAREGLGWDEQSGEM